MTAEGIITKARALFLADYDKELKESGILPPSVNKSPIYPAWTDVEYEAIEKDTAKYFLYYSAINMAMKDMKHSTDTITCFVIGPGRGRLIEFCLDCLKVNKIDGTIHVVECNEKALKLLVEKYDRLENVILHPAVIIRDYEQMKELFQTTRPEENTRNSLKTVFETKCIDIFVSELFGSFSDNEFMPEILSVCVKAFGSENSISIPEKCTNYLTPIRSQLLSSFFEKNGSKNCDLEKVYVLGLSEDVDASSPPQKVYSYDCNGNSGTFSGQVEFPYCLESMSSSEAFSKVAKSDEDGNIHTQSRDTSGNREVIGFAGHFKAVLYKDIYIDTRPGPERNTYSWESAFFPLNHETREAMKDLCSGCTSSGCHVLHDAALQKATHLRLELKRTIQRLVRIEKSKSTTIDGVRPYDTALFKLWYEWTITSMNGEVLSIHNTNGTNHALFL